MDDLLSVQIKVRSGFSPGRGGEARMVGYNRLQAAFEQIGDRLSKQADEYLSQRIIRKAARTGNLSRALLSNRNRRVESNQYGKPSVLVWGITDWLNSQTQHSDDRAGRSSYTPGYWAAIEYGSRVSVGRALHGRFFPGSPAEPTPGRTGQGFLRVTDEDDPDAFLMIVRKEIAAKHYMRDAMQRVLGGPEVPLLRKVVSDTFHELYGVRL